MNIYSIAKNKLFKAGMGYTIANVLIRGISFLTIPIFTRLLSTSEFGDYNVYLSYQSIMSIIIGFAIHSSIKNAKYDYGSSLKEYTSNCIYLISANYIFITVIVNFLYPYIKHFIGFDLICVNLLLIHSASTAIINLYMSRISLEYKYKRYIVLSVISTILNIGVSIILIMTVLNSYRFMGRIVGTAVSIFIPTVYIIYYYLKESFAKINLKYWKYGLVITTPIIIHGIAQTVLNSFDRIIIKMLLGATEAGIYSLIYTIALIPQIIFTSLNSVWEPWIFEKMNQKSYKIIRQKSSDYAFLISVVFMLMMLATPNLITLMAPKEYASAKDFSSIILYGIYFSSLYILPCEIEYYYKKTKLIAIATSVAAVLNIILNYVFVDMFGIVAAAYTTLITYIVYFTFHMIFTKKILKYWLFDIKKIVIYSGLTLVIMILSILFKDSFAIRFILGLIILLYFGTSLRKTLKMKQ